MSEPAPAALLWNHRALSDLLELEALDDHRFRNRYHDPNLNGRAFGGQILGQTLAAAMRTVAHREPTALQILFLQGGDVGSPIDFHVTALQDGKRFSSRHVRAQQAGRYICDAHVSFQQDASGVNHSEPLFEAVPEPESLRTMTQLAELYATEVAANGWRLYEKPCLSFCLIDHERHLFEAGSQPRVKFWIRLKETLPDAASAHCAALAYLSDFWVSSSSMTPHTPLAATRGRIYASSLNHGIWFHGPCRADDWLLFITENPRSYHGRGLSIARVYDRARRHVATVTQECLIAPAL